MMVTPLGPRLLGVPESAVEHRQLGDLLSTMQQYNQEQAVLGACFGPAPPLSAQAQAAGKQQLQALPAPPQSQSQSQEAGAAVVASSPPTGDAAAFASATAAAAAAPATAAAAAAAIAAAAAAQASAADRAAEQARHAACALHYSRMLAAAALWLALGTKNLAEDPAVAGSSVGRLLARSFSQVKGVSVAAGNGDGRHQVRAGAAWGRGAGPWSCCPGIAGLVLLRGPQPLSPSPRRPLQATPTLVPPPPRPSGSAVAEGLQEAVQHVLTEGLPVLEHNGFQHLWQLPTGTGAAAASARLAQEVAKVGGWSRRAGRLSWQVRAIPQSRRRRPLPLPCPTPLAVLHGGHVAGPGRVCAGLSLRLLLAAVQPGGAAAHWARRHPGVCTLPPMASGGPTVFCGIVGRNRPPLSSRPPATRAGRRPQPAPAEARPLCRTHHDRVPHGRCGRRCEASLSHPPSTGIHRAPTCTHLCSVARRAHRLAAVAPAGTAQCAGATCARRRRPLQSCCAARCLSCLITPAFDAALVKLLRVRRRAEERGPVLGPSGARLRDWEAREEPPWRTWTATVRPGGPAVSAKLAVTRGRGERRLGAP